MELLKIIGALTILRAASPAIYKWAIAWPMYTLAYTATFSLVGVITLNSIAPDIFIWSFLTGAALAAVAT